MSIELKAEHYRMTWQTARRILSDLPVETAVKILNCDRCDYRMSSAMVRRGGRRVKRFCLVYQNTVIIRNAADWRKHNTIAGFHAAQMKVFNRLVDSQ